MQTYLKHFLKANFRNAILRSEYNLLGIFNFRFYLFLIKVFFLITLIQVKKKNRKRTIFFLNTVLRKARVAYPYGITGLPYKRRCVQKQTSPQKLNLSIV